METPDKNFQEPAPLPVTNASVNRAYPGIFQALCLVLALVLVELLLYGLGGAFSTNANLDSPRFAIYCLISTVVVLGYGWWKTKATFSEVFPLTRVRWFLLFEIAVCLIGLYVLTFNIGIFIYAFYPTPPLIRQLLPDQMGVGGYWSTFFWTVMIAPAMEELLFRGVILRGFLKRYGPVNAVVASAVLFGAIYGSVWHFPSAFIIGLILGWCAVETKSLLPCLFGHAFWNFLALELFTFPHWLPSAHLSNELKSLQLVPEWFVLVGACMFGLGVFMLGWRFWAGRNDEAGGLSQVLRGKILRIPSGWQWKWKKRRWPIVVLALVFVSPYVIGGYLPWFWAQIWYLRHLNGVPFMGKVIPVPRGMVGGDRSLPGYDSISFDELPTIHGNRKDLGWGMSFSPDKIPHASTEHAVKQLGIRLTEFADRVPTTVGPAFAVDTQEGEGWCYTMPFPTSSSLMTNCLLFDARWSATYDGPPGDEKKFFKVIAGIHDARK